MTKARVYFQPIDKDNLHQVSEIACRLLEKLVKEEKIKLGKEIPLKVHVGEPGNTSYIKPKNFNGVIDYLQNKKIKTYFIETVTVTGPRNTAGGHKKVAEEHGFTHIPFVIADGKNGTDHVSIGVSNGKYFKTAKIARELANRSQVLILSHFKGHIDSGFGGAIKNLGIGFASRIGKMEQHSRHFSINQRTINWNKDNEQFHGTVFRERTAEYALAAASGKKHLYLNFALNLVSDCDCDGRPFIPLYQDLGLFASTDPVAVDKACFDLLKKREGKKPFPGEDIFAYSQKLGLGTPEYQME